ncbi:hypothetical protein Hanom_Chr04g00355941 [Helianthus anomalus]
MALEAILEGLESKEVETKSEVVYDAETSISGEKVGEQLLEEKVVEQLLEPLLEPLADPWDSSVCDGECDCAIMNAMLWYHHNSLETCVQINSLLLEKQIKSNVKFGIGFRKNDQVSENTVVNESRLVEIVPTNLASQEIKSKL